MTLFLTASAMADLGQPPEEIESHLERPNQVSQQIGEGAERIQYVTKDKTLDVFVTYWQGKAALVEYEKANDEPFTEEEISYLISRTIEPEKVSTSHDATYRQYRLGPAKDILIRLLKNPDKEPVDVELMTRDFFERIEFPKYKNAFPGINASMADIVLERAGLPGTAMVSDHLTYRVVVTNAGPETAQNVVLKEYAGNQQFVEITCDREGAEIQFRDRDNEATVQLGDLGVGESLEVTFKIRLAASGRLILTSNTTAGSVDPDSSNSDLITRDTTKVSGKPVE